MQKKKKTNIKSIKNTFPNTLRIKVFDFNKSILIPLPDYIYSHTFYTLSSLI